MTSTRDRRWRERIVAFAVVAVAAAAVIGVMAYNRRAADQIAREIYVPRRITLTREMQLLQEYVRINTSNPPGNETAGARWLGDQLRQAGIPFEIVESAPGRGNLYARIKGKTNGGALMLLNHIDVMPAPPEAGKWARPPFAASVVGNMVYGRGTLDMKGIAICQLLAFIDVAKSGRTPEHDVVFLATADEERESVYGMAWLLEHRLDMFEGVQYVLNEGGLTEMEKEQITYFGIELGSKQVVELRLVGATRDQLQRARIALEPYAHPPEPTRVDPEVREFLRAVAPNRLEVQAVLADIDRTIADGKFWLVPPLNRELLQNTVWTFGIDRTGGGAYSMRVLLSNLPAENPDDRVRWLSDVVRPFGVSVGEILRKQGPAPLSTHNTRLFEILSREARRHYGAQRGGPEVLPMSTSDCRFLRRRGTICYGFQPFPADFFQTQAIHLADERIRLDWFQLGTRTMRDAVAAYAFAE